MEKQSHGDFLSNSVTHSLNASEVDFLVDIGTENSVHVPNDASLNKKN